MIIIMINRMMDLQNSKLVPAYYNLNHLHYMCETRYKNDIMSSDYTIPRAYSISPWPYSVCTLHTHMYTHSLLFENIFFLHADEICTNISVPACTSGSSAMNCQQINNELLEKFKQTHPDIYAEECNRRILLVYRCYVRYMFIGTSQWAL